LHEIGKYMRVSNHPVSKRGSLGARLKMQMQIYSVVFEFCQIVCAQLAKENKK